MSSEKPVVAIVGLGMIGASIGLALIKAQVASQVVGHDRDASAASKAKKLGAVDRTDWNLISACEKADLVILAVPLSGIQETLTAIGPHLRPGCVVIDTAVLKKPVLEWADTILPEHVHFVGLNPIVGATVSGKGGVEAARADLFQNGLVCILPSRRAGSDAVKLGIDLVTVLGARPLFYDPVEHDSLLAAVDQLPFLLSFAMLETVIHEPTWRELRKLAGPVFETSTLWAETDPAALTELFLSNRENLVRWTDAFVAALTSLRDLLAEGAAPTLVKPFEQAQQERSKWLQLRAQGDWEEGPRPELPSKQSLFQPLLGGLWPRKRKKGEETRPPKG